MQNMIAKMQVEMAKQGTSAANSSEAVQPMTNTFMKAVRRLMTASIKTDNVSSCGSVVLDMDLVV